MSLGVDEGALQDRSIREVFLDAQTGPRPRTAFRLQSCHVARVRDKVYLEARLAQWRTSCRRDAPGAST